MGCRRGGRMRMKELRRVLIGGVGIGRDGG